MKKIGSLILTLFLTVLFVSGQKQEVNDIEFLNRKGQLFFTLGTELRITPLPYDNRPLDSGTRVYKY